MTIQDLKGMTRLNLTPAQAGAILGIDPNTIRWQARRNRLGARRSETLTNGLRAGSTCPAGRNWQNFRGGT